MKNISILGSTGSIGTQTLQVVRELNCFNIIGLAANSNIKLLEEEIREFRPKFVAVYDQKKALQLRQNIRDTNTKVFWGDEGLLKISFNEYNELLVVCLLGLYGLMPVIEAIKNKINIAIATKEIIVAAGQLIMDCAKQNNVEVIPIDSEHCAIGQCLKDNYKNKINRIILTASGGPFRNMTLSQLNNVTVEDALKHPNWAMGQKITVDSATLMNKGLEVIEARWLFDVPPEKIDVVIHPESIIHSMVEYIDGSIIAQLSNTDMKIPIQYALTYPNTKLSNNRLNLIGKCLTFEKPDRRTLSLLDLCYDAISIGGSMPAVISSANSAAVELFLNKKISFLDIQRIVEKCSKSHKVLQNPNVNQILECHIWAKNFVTESLKMEVN